ERIRAQSVNKSGVSLFALIARQRQMASSMVAALQSWSEKGLLEELLWEDLGRSVVLDQANEVDADDIPLDDVFKEIGLAGAEGENEIDLVALESVDGKYKALLGFLKDEIGKNPSEKFVVFAFFRGTLRYLERRLQKDGIRTALIMGGMGEMTETLL